MAICRSLRTKQFEDSWNCQLTQLGFNGIHGGDEQHAKLRQSGVCGLCYNTEKSILEKMER